MRSIFRMIGTPIGAVVFAVAILFFSNRIKGQISKIAPGVGDLLS